MNLTYKSLTDSSKWNATNIELPKFDIETVKENTKINPKWLHFGAGNIFRAFVSSKHQDLLNSGVTDTGIIAVESFDFEVIDKIYKPCDNLSLLVAMKADGSSDKRVIASITEGITTKDSALETYFTNPELQMVSFTITEKGYSLKTADGKFMNIINADLENGPENPIHVMSIITAMLNKRFKDGAAPLTLVSMDNCSHNGDKLKDAVLTIATEWWKKGFVEPGFVEYVKDETKISFPLSMIDKITPRPSDVVKNQLTDLGLTDMDIVITEKGTYMAPFVNAEICEYLVIEDKFTNGRPPLDQAGIIFTDRDTVNSVETMKVTTCLNPLHTALAVTGCLLGYTLIADEMKDPLLKKLVETIGYKEGLKTVINPGIIDPKQFIDEVINERFSNPSIPDTPQRIATDTSMKVGIRFGHTIKSYIDSIEFDVDSLVGIPLAIAAWCRYLNGTDDNGAEITLSPDPQLDALQSDLKNDGVISILSNSDLFGLDLYETGLGNKIENMYSEMMAGKGAIRSTIEKYLD